MLWFVLIRSIEGNEEIFLKIDMVILALIFDLSMIRAFEAALILLMISKSLCVLNENDV